MRILCRAAFVLMLLLAPAKALALPPVWVVHDADSTVVLFGSVHLLPPGLDWRPPELAKALATADDVWFEAPMDAAGLTAATQAAVAHAYLPDGQSLETMLSRKDRARLEQAAAGLGYTPAQFDRLRPWYADLLVSGSLYQKIGAKGPDGVEQQLWSGVSPTAKRVALETPEQQVGFFADAAMPDQLASLRQTLRDMNDAEHDYGVLLAAWMTGDIKTLDREVVRPLRKASPRLYSTLVVQRNTRWTDRIVERLHGSGRTVIVVGMGHLIGSDGLPARLRARGYEVDGPP
jgi:hypothetical protein